MYSYSFASNPNMVGMLYGRITERPSGLSTYESLGTTYATTPHARLDDRKLVTPDQFNRAEHALLQQMSSEVLTIPTEVEDLEALVREATNVWRDLLGDAQVATVWTDYDEVMKQTENKTDSGLILPLGDDYPENAFAMEEFDHYRATTEEMLSIGFIENNIVAMTSQEAPGDYF